MAFTGWLIRRNENGLVGVCWSDKELIVGVRYLLPSSALCEELRGPHTVKNVMGI